MSQRFGPRMALMTGGLLVWAALFLFCYIFTALACAHGLARAQWLGVGVIPLVLGVANAAGLVGLAWLLRLAGRLDTHAARRADDTESVTADVASMVCLLALIAIVWNAIAPLVIGIRC